MKKEIIPNAKDDFTGIVGLHPGLQQRASLKNEIEADHTVPTDAINKAIEKCKSSSKCSPARMRQLQKLKNNPVAITLLKYEEHHKTASWGPNGKKFSEEMANKLVDGDFAGAIEMGINQYKEFGDKYKDGNLFEF